MHKFLPRIDRKKRVEFLIDIFCSLEKLVSASVIGGFAVNGTGIVGSTKHWVTVPKCLHKIPKFIKHLAH